MRSKIVQRIMDKTPEDVGVFVGLYADLVIRINQILEEKGYTQKDLAEKMGKQPSEINKWLAGDHNFTLRSIAKLEAELGEPLLRVPPRKAASAFQSIPTANYTIVLINNPHGAKGREWPAAGFQTLLSNVG